MDSFRFVIALALCMLIMVGWTLFFQPKPQPVPQGNLPPVPAAAPQAPRPPPPPALGAVQPPPLIAEADQPEQTAEISINGAGEPERLKLKVSSREGGISGVWLPRYRTRDGKDPLVLIPEDAGAAALLGLWIDQPTVQFDRRKGHGALRNWALEAAPDKGSAAFTKEIDGVLVRKEIRAIKDRYHVEVSLVLENRSAENRQLHYRIQGPSGMPSESLRTPGTDLNLVWGDRGGDGATVNNVLTVSSIKGDWVSPYADRIVLVGSSNNYFAGVLAGADPQTQGQLKSGHADTFTDPRNLEELARAEYKRPFGDLLPDERSKVEGKAFKNVRTAIASRDTISLAPGATVTHRFLLFLGPREAKVLAEYPQFNLPEINYYGWWTMLVKIFLQVLKGLHAVLFSWGLAIIGLTFIVRACLHPINRRQQASMMRYQKKVGAIKPQMDALKERYANNKVKMNQEVQKLFKENHINPGQMMGGCLMIFLQLPVWYALYSSIEVSLDLRGAPFLWITDLTQSDRLVAPLPFTIPFLGTDLNLLPFIYVILTILQQKMQPKPTDPQMQQQMRMMTFMMVFFGFIFYAFPAGFLLYFIASASISMVESKIIKKILAREGLGPNAGALAAAGGAGPVPLVGQALYPAKKTGEGKRK